MSTYNKFTFDGVLNSEQMNFFQTHGFIYFETFESNQTVSEIIHATEQAQVCSVKTELPRLKRTSAIHRNRNRQAIVKEIAFNNLYTNEISEYAQDRDVLEVTVSKNVCLESNERNFIAISRYVNFNTLNFSSVDLQLGRSGDILHENNISPALCIFHVDQRRTHISK